MSWWSNNITDKAVNSLCKTLRRRKLTCGAEVERFESEFCKVHNMRYGVMTTSGTMALIMSGLALGLQKNSKVIVSGSSWIASAQAAAILGAKVDFLDIDLSIGAVRITSFIAKKIKEYNYAILVHYNGREVEGLELLKKAKVKLIEDCCKAMFVPGQNNMYVGSQGEISCFSFGMFSLLPIGYGGFAATNCINHYKNLKRIRDHGVVRGTKERYRQLGLNGKPTDFQAALAYHNLTEVDQRISKVKKINEIYFNTLNTRLFSELGKSKVPLHNDTLCKFPNKTKQILKEMNIPFGLFHPPLNAATYLNQTMHNNLPNADHIYRNGIHLPCGPSQNLDKVYKLAKQLNSKFK